MRRLHAGPAVTLAACLAGLSAMDGGPAAEGAEPRRLHLMEPCDNRIGPGAPVKPPCESVGHHVGPVTFAWEPAAKGAEYEVLIGRVECSSPVYIPGAVLKKKTDATKISVTLPPTPPDQTYSLHIYARREGWELARLWMGRDWNYEFRVADADGRFTPDPLCFDKKYRWHAKDQTRRSESYPLPAQQNTRVLPAPPSGAPAPADWKAGAVPPLFSAIQRSDMEALRSALENGADPAAAWDGKNALHSALENFHAPRAIPLLLLEKGAPLDLLAAASVGTDEQLKAILAKRADLDLRTPMKKSALHLAVHYGRPSAVRLLLAAGAAPDPEDFAKNTPLGWAAQGDPAAAQVLIEGGADVNHLDALGQSPLYYASTYGKTQVAALLLGKGAKAGVPGQQGFTCLHMAARYGRTDIVKLLLENGAEVNAKDRRGKTALDMLREQGKENLPEIEAVLRAHGAR